MGKRIRRQASNHHLPEEIIEEILTYLPVKSLLRFKCVSKQWRYMISSKSFTQEHLKKSSQFTHHQLIYTSFSDSTLDYCVFDHTRQRLRSCSLMSFLDEPNKRCSKITTLDHHPGNSDLFTRKTSEPSPFPLSIRILGSCNGLILITFNMKDLFLWNLSTRKFRAIPPPCFPYSVCTRFQYGLGYDDSTDDYKVVGISFSPKPYQTKIYSLKTDSWKKIEDYVEGSPVTFRHPGNFVNGKMYWEAMYLKDDPRDRWNIVSLSLVEEKYEILARPKHFLDYRYGERTLQVLGGYLSFLGTSSGLDATLWVMNKYGEAESWTKIWTLSDFPDPKRHIKSPRPKPLWLNENGDLGVVFGASTVVVVYNGKSKLRKSRVDTTILDYSIYVESLVSPFGDEVLGEEPVTSDDK